MNESLKSKLENLPASPGVYQFKDNSGKVIYVGKAKILKNRVRQYFHSQISYGRIPMMVSKIKDLEIITTDNEVEALILEFNLIKELKPRYNVNLKDDKSYPYIVITKELFPRVFPTRQKRTDGSRYFGPYTDVKTMRYALKTIRDIFLIRSCHLNLTEENIKNKKFKLCLDYHIHKCEGPCEGLVNSIDYNEMIDEVAKLLNGKTSTLIKELTERMDEYSANMQFEKAANLRDKINAISVYSTKQKMVDEEIIDRDIFAVETSDNDGCGMVLKIRDGRVIGKSHFYLNNVLEKEEDELIENLVINYYSKSDFIPAEIYLQKEIEDIETIKNWLEKKDTKKVTLVVPKIGEKAKLVNMVKANAKLMLEELKLAKMKREFIAPSVEALKHDLRMENLPRRIECFDISHIQGTDTVASMVVFQDGKTRKSEYRKYKIDSVSGETGQPDDFLSMREVVFRRYRRLIEEKKSFPDLIVIDGGKGQLSSAVKVLMDLKILPEQQDKDSLTRVKHERSNVKGEEHKVFYSTDSTHSKHSTHSLTIIGLAKKLDEVYFPRESDPYTIPKTSSGLKLLQRIRDEAHRFAVTFHQDLRDKRTLTTELLEVKGIGEKTAKKLLTEFGSVEALKEKLENNYEEVEKVAGEKTAEILKEYFATE
jgi:excinuclease ABC subunit C